MKFTHVRDNEDYMCKSMHISHLHQWVSAYETNDENVKDLVEALDEGLAKAKLEVTPVIVDQDGYDFFFVCNPSGSMDLCVRWRSFRPNIVDAEESDEPDKEAPQDPEEKPGQILRKPWPLSVVSIQPQDSGAAHSFANRRLK